MVDKFLILLLVLGIGCHVLDLVVESHNRLLSLGIFCPVWNWLSSQGIGCGFWKLVVQSGNWFSSLQIGCRLLETIVEFGNWLLSLGIA